MIIILKHKDMETLLFNTDFSNNAFSNRDVLSVFKEAEDKKLSIHQGMTVTEISEFVSEKIIAVVKEQFEATKAAKEKK